MTDYEWLTAMGLCHRCRKNKVAPNKKFCFDCLDKIREENAKKYSPEQAKAYQPRRREIYREKKAKGICVRCNKKATHGMYCYECYIKEKRRNHKKAEKRKQERHERGLVSEYRKENKLCLFCGKPIEQENVRKGFLVCQYHREQASINSRKAKNCPQRLAQKADIAMIMARKGRWKSGNGI